MGPANLANTFPALETLELMCLIQLEEWREDTQSEKWFPCLKRLVVLDCPSLKKLPLIPTALKELRLTSLKTATLPGFKKKNEGSSTNQSPEQLASLEELDIYNCDNLVHLPSEGFRELISLKSLRIEECRRLFLLPMLLPKNFFPPSVQQLILSSCGDLVACLPQLLEDLSLISVLKLENCANLISLPSANVLQSLTSLKELQIRSCRCPMLATKSPLDLIEESPRNRLSMALDRLYIDHPDLLLVVPLRNLHLTKSVEISGSHSITLLPEQWLLRNGASLRSLGLFGKTLRSVETLPDSLQSLLSLRDLVLHQAYKLMRLPELPTSLEILQIYGCSEELAGRLKGGGLDYNKIRHLDVAIFEVLSQSEISQLFS